VAVARAATATRQDELHTGDQNQLILATQAYFEALPALHRTFIAELSAQREEGPVAVIGKAIADGLERLVLEGAGVLSNE
jgi:hypothetical protein